MNSDTRTNGEVTPLLPNSAGGRNYYVYAHADSSGRIFYIGKGTGSRAEQKVGRNELWEWYVSQYLGGHYRVLMLHEGLGDLEAQDIEGHLIDKHMEFLVNLVNPSRNSGEHIFLKFYEFRETNRDLIRLGQDLERHDLERAITIYLDAIEAIADYSLFRRGRGFASQLLEDMDEKLGKVGDIRALDRLTACLIRVGRPHEAEDHAKLYFTRYRRDLQRPAADRIMKRIQKALFRKAATLKKTAVSPNQLRKQD